MSQFTLLITGLCSFVPKFPVQQADNEMTVLMVESSTEIQLGSSHQNHELHAPALICPLSKVLPDSGFRVPDLTFFSRPYVYPSGQGIPENQQDEEMAVFFLDDQEITVADAPPDSLDIIIRDEGQYCPTTDTPESFSWVVPIGEVNPGAELVRDRCFSSLDCDPSVISRLCLTEGSIGTGKMATTIRGKINTWQFEEAGEHQHDSADEDSRALAAVVKYACTSSSPVVLETRLLRTRHQPRRSKNRRVEAIFSQNGGGSLRIRLQPDTEAWVKVMPLLDILQIRQLEERHSDPHFAHLYKVSDRIGELSLKVPYVVGECHALVDLRHLGGIDCPPKQGVRIQTAVSDTTGR